MTSDCIAQVRIETRYAASGERFRTKVEKTTETKRKYRAAQYVLRFGLCMPYRKRKIKLVEMHYFMEFTPTGTVQLHIHTHTHTYMYTQMHVNISSHAVAYSRCTHAVPAIPNERRNVFNIYSEFVDHGAVSIHNIRWIVSFAKWPTCITCFRILACPGFKWKKKNIKKSWRKTLKLSFYSTIQFFLRPHLHNSMFLAIFCFIWCSNDGIHLQAAPLQCTNSVQHAVKDNVLSGVTSHTLSFQIFCIQNTR